MAKTEEIRAEMIELGKRAKAAARVMATLTTQKKNDVLTGMAEALVANSERILAANEKDMATAAERGISSSLIDRLMLNSVRIKEMAEALDDVAILTDPVGETVKGWRVPNGLEIRQVRVPLGVIGIIYEARPNVTVEASGLSIKSGNAIILRGGSMAHNSNIALTEVIADAAADAGLPRDAIQAVANPSREAAEELMRLNHFLDLLVPRGGPELIHSVVSHATVPVLWAGAGNCHVYVDESADLDMAQRIVINAKCQRPSVCNAAETLLVHRVVADEFLPRVAADLAAQGVTVVGDEATRKLVPQALEATEKDWYTEYLELKIAVRVVDSVQQAIDHINTYGTMHSEAIITRDHMAARKFTEEVDAAAVYVNASTRFTDGGQFGLGAEIGISTQKLHVRGPMGLTALTSTKYIIEGTGQVRL
ncbi:MAG TPA: glutamate-5-semialdehyde dehydrogenase [Anaerolineae bacterium]|jgi:glutamate-5-semialdehyde dehydrogenase|nr:glutamate-5-semialdehyde dehydrogenase [Anaerolineae bacterium]